MQKASFKRMHAHSTDIDMLMQRNAIIPGRFIVLMSACLRARASLTPSTAAKIKVQNKNERVRFNYGRPLCSVRTTHIKHFGAV